MRPSLLAVIVSAVSAVVDPAARLDPARDHLGCACGGSDALR
jgi:hypothetical protein